MSNFRMRGLLAALALCLPVSAMAQQVGSGAVALTGPGAGASEDFNSLANAHQSTSDVLPTGWYFLEVGNSNANGTYLVDDGSSNSGNTFSYGSIGSTDRALGTLASGSVQSTIGAQLRNDSGAVLSDLDISFFVEQWRLGDLNGADILAFAYSTNATSFSSGTWTNFPPLDAVAPVTAGTASTRLDGNAAANRALVSATLTGLNLAPGASLWIRWTDTNDAGVDDALAIDDVVFGTPVDVAPTLLSSVPVDGATDFPADGSVLLTFSEPVDVAGKWFTIACADSGDHTPTNTDVSGGPVSFFLTPATELVVGETCELSFDTTLITDQGPSTYPLEDPGTISFAVAEPPPNVPPTVTSTVPQQGATNFPSAGDLKVTFSEPVNTTSGAFSLTCAESTGIVLSPTSTDGGVNFSINTGTALVAGDECEFGIHSNAVVDLDGAALDDDYLIVFNVFSAADVGNYYQNVNLSSPEQLRCTLHETIKGHTTYPYGWENLEIADEAPPDVCAPGSTSPENYILDVYRNRCYLKVAARSNPVGPNNYNREHVWPRSIGFKPTHLAAHNDLHMLHLSASDHNGTRDNDPYDNCTGSGCSAYGTDANNGVGGTGPRGNSNWSNGSVFEVWDEKKGDMARVLFYMAIRYEGIPSEDAHDGDIPDLELTDNMSLIQITSNTASHAYMGRLSTLLQWHQQDQPDQRELQRTGVVQSFQGNRNPFIDHPEWASAELFNSQKPSQCVLNTFAPEAGNDSYSTAENTPLSVSAANGVLANDSDTEGAPLSAQRLNNPSQGSLTLAADGSFSYTPNAGFCGIDSFTYSTSDGTRRSAPASVTIAVGENCGTPEPEIAIFADGFEVRD